MLKQITRRRLLAARYDRTMMLRDKRKGVADALRRARQQGYKVIPSAGPFPHWTLA
jgi:hypothetical protein